MSSENIYASDASFQPRPGMSGGAKVILGIGLGCGFLTLLSCAGFVVLSALWFKGATTSDPAEVRRLTDEIVSIDMPEGFEPKTAMNFKIPFASSGPFVMVFWANGENSLALAQVASVGDKGEIEQMRAQFEKVTSQHNQRERMTIEDTAPHDTEIHGEPAHFTIEAGRTGAGKTVREARGEFKGSQGPALLFFVGDAEKFSQEAVIRMLDSMK